VLVKIGELLKKAQANKAAIGCFNVYNLETISAVVEAAEEFSSPVIVATTPKAIEYAGLDNLSVLVRLAAASVKIPVVLHLDHGHDIETIRACIKAGYTSLMIDGSSFPLSQNIALTKEAGELAHNHGLSIEGELGELSGDAKLTEPSLVPKFVKETGIDSLAVSIGSKHGHAKDESLKLHLLDKIRKKTNLPLVLHGSSGVSDSDIKGAIMRGMVKINVDTFLREEFTFAVKESLKGDPIDPRVYLDKAKKAVRRAVSDRILLFGSANV